ncbi:MAG: hypothetical protein QOG49_1695 [Frankiaceae bacterium]|nr:hypothetical protein [Frankiaceae bacterium]
MDVVELHRRAVDYFTTQVDAVPDDKWDAPSTCAEWTVRDLVNHVTAEDLWMPPLLAGRTIADVGAAYDGDVLGADPKRSYAEAAADALAAARVPGAMQATTHLSFGDFPGSEYAMQLFADHLIHGWDLARSSGADDTLDPELVSACADWFAEREEPYRQGGVIGPRPAEGSTGDAQTDLLAAFGRRR